MLALWFLLTGCITDIDAEGRADRDNDNAPSDVDCDDENPSVNPSATELCNGIDDNCDGVVDGDDAVGKASGFADLDGDGVGGAAISACVLPEGSVDQGGDCNDEDAAVLPGATERCNEVDDDCDGDVDESLTVSSWYVDSDGDGFGSEVEPVTHCAAPTGYVDNGTDCDDADAGVNPSAEDAWYDGVDSNCDGANDYDADGDGALDPLGGGDDCDDTDASVNPSAIEVYYDGVDADCDGQDDDDADGDGFAAASRGGDDCDDSDASVNPSAAEVCDEADQDCDGVADDGLATAIWYVDGDGDGFGVAENALDVCGAPSGYAEQADDCDDTDADINPDVTDAWYDGVDSNCDGADDYDADGDGHRAPSGGGEDCDDTESAVNPAADEVCDDGVDNDCDDKANGCSWFEGGELGTPTTLLFSARALHTLNDEHLVVVGGSSGNRTTWVVEAPLGEGTYSDSVAVAHSSLGNMGMYVADVDLDGRDELLLAGEDWEQGVDPYVALFDSQSLVGELVWTDALAHWSVPDFGGYPAQVLTGVPLADGELVNSFMFEMDVSYWDVGSSPAQGVEVQLNNSVYAESVLGGCELVPGHDLWVMMDGDQNLELQAWAGIDQSSPVETVDFDGWGVGNLNDVACVDINGDAYDDLVWSGAAQGSNRYLLGYALGASNISNVQAHIATETAPSESPLSACSVVSYSTTGEPGLLCSLHDRIELYDGSLEQVLSGVSSNNMPSPSFVVPRSFQEDDDGASVAPVVMMDMNDDDLPDLVMANDDEVLVYFQRGL